MKVAFSIATGNFLAQAKTVGDSFLKHHPDDKFVIVLVDKLTGIDKSDFKGVEIIEVEALGISFFQEMVDRYSLFELSNSLKPFCAEFILAHVQEASALIYLDCDLFIYSNLNEVDRLLTQYDILITPHFFTPLPVDGVKQNERHFLNSGLYNGGFFAINRNPEAAKFIQWWKERLKTLCFVDVAKGLFVDQIWLNYVPLYFKNVHLLQHPGFNVAYWNLHERHVGVKDGNYVVNGSDPLVFFHFSGYQVERKDVLAKYQNRYNFQNRAELFPLFEEYRNTLLNNKYIQISARPCFYNNNKKKEAVPRRKSKISRLYSGLWRVMSRS